MKGVIILSIENCIKKEIERTQTKNGVVAHCKFLNIRKFPSETASIVKVINAGETVTIDMTKFSNNFYKVITEFGDEGYANKNFIEV